MCLLVSVLALSNILVNSDMYKFPSILAPFPVSLLLLHAEKKDNTVAPPWAELLTQPFSEPRWLKGLAEKVSIATGAVKIIFIFTIYSGKVEGNVNKNLKE